VYGTRENLSTNIKYAITEHVTTHTYVFFRFYLFEVKGDTKLNELSTKYIYTPSVCVMQVVFYD